MKIFRIIKKNFKLLLRSKITAIVVVIAPLLIILLAGVAFNNKDSESDLIVGIYLQKNTTLSASFMAQLENSSFEITHFSSEQECKDAIKQSNIQACMVFPEDFEIMQDRQAELFVYADYSRTNFVFYLVESISKSLNTKTSELSVGLTTQILDALDNAKQKNSEASLKLVQMKSSLEELENSADTLKSKLDAINAEKENVGITDISSSLVNLKSDIDDLKQDGVDAVGIAIEAGEAALDEYPDISDWGNNNETYNILIDARDLNDSLIVKTHNESIKEINEMLATIDAASEAVKKIEDKLAKVKDFKTSGSTDLSSIKTKLTSLKSDAEAIKSSLEGVNQQISSLSITSAERIVNPIKTNLQPVVTETNNINYMFPYLIMLITMFVCILLSSTTIIMEKKSKAYFRNFTTPTSDLVFIISTYLTNIIIVVLQLFVLFVLAKFALGIPIINNLHFSILALFIGITLFTAIGMGIGYWFSSQEAAIMLSMSVASIFILVSNLILPLEVMPATIQAIAGYNPYVMLSELLRQLIIFNIIPNTIAFTMVILASAAILIFLIIILIQKVSKLAYFKKLPHTKKQKLDKRKEVRHKNAFKLYERTIENQIDLLNELKKMDDETFATYVSKDKNDFYNWAKYVLKDKKLANKLKVRTRQEMIGAIEQQ